MRNLKVLSIGEIIFDIYGENAEIGGAPLNFCAHCALLGAESALISAVGKDEWGEKAKIFLKGFGVDTGFVGLSELETGKCLVTVDENAVPSYDVLRPAAYDNIRLDENIIGRIRAYSADVFAFGTLIQRETVSRAALNKILSECKFKEIFCDINLRKDCYDRESCLTCLRNATVLKLSDEEEPLLAGFGFYENSADMKEKLKAISEAFKNISVIIYTMGEKGSAIYKKCTDEFFTVKAVKTETVSTVGAGDSYSAAFLNEYIKSGDIPKAAKAGSELAAFVVAHREAIPTK